MKSKKGLTMIFSKAAQLYVKSTFGKIMALKNMLSNGILILYFRFSDDETNIRLHTNSHTLEIEWAGRVAHRLLPFTWLRFFCLFDRQRIFILKAANE